MSVQRFRKKPVVIEALRWTGYNYTESEVFLGESVGTSRYAAPSAERGNGWPDGPYANSDKIISTLEGDMRCQPGDWIIKGVKGEFYPVDHEIFVLTYELET